MRPFLRTAGAARLLRLALSICASSALLAALAPPAGADSILNPCQGQNLTQPFLPWLDPAYYTLAPNGAIESSAGWTLAKGAKLVSGNEPYYVHSSSDKTSLSLPSGSSATTSKMCVSLTHADLRLFVRNTGSVLTTLRVEVLYTDVLGASRSALISAVAGTPSWQPTLPMPILLNLTALPLATNGTTQVAFRFTPLGALSGFTIDDVYVDPYQGR